MTDASFWGEDTLCDRLGSLLWEIGSYDGSNEVIGDARMTKFISIALFERPDGGQVARVAASNRDGGEIPPWELKGLIKHLNDTLDPTVVYVLAVPGEEEEGSN